MQTKMLVGKNIDKRALKTRKYYKQNQFKKFHFTFFSFYQNYNFPLKMLIQNQNVENRDMNLVNLQSKRECTYIFILPVHFFQRTQI